MDESEKDQEIERLQKLNDSLLKLILAMVRVSGGKFTLIAREAEGGKEIKLMIREKDVH